jgi:hypothetical protein
MSEGITWQEALETVVLTTKHEVYRARCAETHPDHLMWRENMITRATGVRREPAKMPPIREEAKHFWRAIKGLVKSGFRLTPKPVRKERVAICLACDRCVNNRCNMCGCFIHKKAMVATERCPLNPPKWLPVPEPTS